MYLLQSGRIYAVRLGELLLHLRYHRLLYVTLLVSFSALLVSTRWVGLNTSPSSAPVGFYWREKPALKRGQLVEVCLPSAWARFARGRGYIGHSWNCPDGSESIVKVIRAMPGDTLWIDPATVLSADTQGRPMPHVFGNQHLGKNQVWLYGKARNSLDSRYVGPVPAANVRANWEPLWTWGEQ